MSAPSQRIAVLGAGPMGLAVAYQLARDGHQPVVFEADDRVGGMTACFDFSGLEIERYYHFHCTSDTAFLQVLAFFSPDDSRNDLFISNYVTLNVLDALKRVQGTTNVQIFGAKDYAMRIWVKPDRLTQLGLATSDLLRAINEQNAQFAAGKIGQSPTGGPQELVYTITTKGRLADPREFEKRLLLDTYRTFGCEGGQPTFRYSLLDGVKDGFLINPTVVDARSEVTTALLSEQGFVVEFKDEAGGEQKDEFKQRDFEKRFFSPATS